MGQEDVSSILLYSPFVLFSHRTHFSHLETRPEPMFEKLELTQFLVESRLSTCCNEAPQKISS